MNPQFSTTSVESSTPKVVGSLLQVEGSAAPSVWLSGTDRCRGDETTLNIAGFQPVQEQVKQQEIPEVQVTERIQEQIVPERIEEQIGDISLPPFEEETVEVVQGHLQQRTFAPQIQEQIFGNV